MTTENVHTEHFYLFEHLEVLRSFFFNLKNQHINLKILHYEKLHSKSYLREHKYQ